MKILNVILLALVFLVYACASSKNTTKSQGNEPKKVLNWEVSEKIKNPESIYYDPTSKLIFVSNVDGDPTKKDGNGFISVFKDNGEVVKSDWVKNLHAPKGLRSLKDVLWVTDIDKVYAFSIPSGKKLKEYKVKGAKFLNDLAISDLGEILVSDTLGSSLYILKKDKFILLHQGKELDSPNGLLFHQGKLFVAAWGITTNFSESNIGHLYTFDLNSKKITLVSKTPVGNLDGLEWHKDGYFLASDWKAGLIYKITMEGLSEVLYKGEMGLADIGYIPESDKILVPYMMNNKVFSL
jgi:sugar lactone lactonase YvrE